MDECEHIKTKQGMATQVILNQKFSAKAEVCVKCEAVLWTAETQAKLNLWLAKLYSENPERFVLQPRLSKKAIKALNTLATELTGASRGLLMRAMAYVMVEELPHDPRFAADMPTIQTLSAYKDLLQGDATHVRVRLNPRQYMDFQTWGKVMGFAPSRVLEIAVLSCLALIAEYRRRHADEQTRQLTERVIHLLKAA